LEDAREEVAEDAKRSRPRSNYGAVASGEVLSIEARTFAGFNFELGPEFVDFHAGGEAIPALL